MNQPVAIGDDGRPPGDDDGPLLAALKTWFAELRDQHERNMTHLRTELRQARAAAQPVYAPLTGSGLIDASGNLVIDIGGPQQGRRWSVGTVAFSDAGSYWASMGAAVAALCVGNKTGNTVPPNAVRWPFAAGPNAANFSSGQITVIPADNVLLSVTGGTPGQNIQVTLWVQDYDPSFVRTTADV